MGASASKNDDKGSRSGQEKFNEINRTLLNKIENPAGTDPANKPRTTSDEEKIPSLERQQYLDSSIQGKIREELSRLRKQEADVQKRIEETLEEENLDRASQAGKAGAKGKSSILLRQELDDVRQKINRHNQRRQRVDQAPGIKEARETLIKCYEAHPHETLECWQEVQTFRQAVARAESEFVSSLTSNNSN